MDSSVLDTCCCVIKLRTACFVIGYINLIQEIISIIKISVILRVVMMSDLENDELLRQISIHLVIVLGLSLFFVILYLAFTTVLLVGLYQDKADHVKAYLIFGAVFTVMYAINLIYSSCSVGMSTNYSLLLVIPLFFNIYFLLVIRTQYYYMKNPECGPAVDNTA